MPEVKAAPPVAAPALASLAYPGALGENITTDLLNQYTWIFESPYYKSLLEKARLDNPTPLVTSGQSFKVQYTCINRTLLPCKLMDVYFTKNVFKRTNGQVDIQVVGYPELGIAGPDSLRLVADGTTAFSEITGAYVGGQMPVLDLYYLWGLYPSREADFAAVTAILSDLDDRVSVETNGGKVIHHNWYAGNDQFFFSRRPLTKMEDFKGLKTRSHGTTMSDLINGMGGEAQFVAFAETYTALERGILDAGATGATAGYGLRWFEVAKYIWGPVISMPADMLVFNSKTWAKFPADIQQILIEEGAKQELENLRLAPEWNETGLPKNIEKGMTHNPITPEMYQYIVDEVVIKRMLPGWIKRVGGPTSKEVALFNEKVSPIAGIRINPDATVVKTREIKIGGK
jgi:C4-dicarboxylate-binding protein DctP